MLLANRYASGQEVLTANRKHKLVPVVVQKEDEFE